MSGRIDHIGVVVDSLEDAKRFLGDVLGLSLTNVLHLPEGRIDAAFFSCGDVSIEIIEVGDADVRRTRLGDGQSARIEHIAIEVDDLEEAVGRLRSQGVQTTHDEATVRGSTQSFWTRPETSDGVAYQLLSRD